MRKQLVVAFAVLSFASLAHADGINVDGAVIPNGSVVTSVQQMSFEGFPATLVSFSFADGTGWIENQYAFGSIGALDFTTPVSDLSLDWYGDFFLASDNVGDVYYESNEDNSPTGIAAFAGPGITSVQWGFSVNSGTAGIESVSYTLDGTDPPSVPEPSALLLSGAGLAALISLACRNRVAAPKT
jgi:hypothetical protein